jgi:hypothetical protein
MGKDGGLFVVRESPEVGATVVELGDVLAVCEVLKMLLAQ